MEKWRNGEWENGRFYYPFINKLLTYSRLSGVPISPQYPESSLKVKILWSDASFR
jgi:hypothetical protein